MLSYTIEKGKVRTNLTLRSLKAYPNQPSTRAVHNAKLPASGTPSIVVRFKSPRIFLQAGFPSATEMNEVYAILR